MEDPADRRFALAAAWTRILSPAQIDEALRTRATRGEDELPFGDWLVRARILSAEQRDEVLRAPPPDAPSRAVHDTANSPSTAAPETEVARTKPSGGETVPAQIGRLGRYELREELGRGGMGVVFRAYDLELRREVALKTLLLGDKQNPELVERLLREARTAATLAHPGIVPIHDAGVIDGVPYFAMAYLRGRTLDRAVREPPLPSIRERVRWIARVADAVAHAHERSVIHRDLKPSNILLDDEGGVHVMDFGLARRLDEGGKLTVTGQMIGTPQYMPPEQIEGERALIGPPCDVYALGAVLYELLAGRPPFPGDTIAEIVGKALSRDPAPIRGFDPKVHPDLETVCAKALDKDPRRRYPNGRAIAQDLERWLNGEPIEARPVTWRTVVVRRMARQKLLTASAAAALLACAWAAWTVRSNAALERAQSELRAEVRKTLREQAGLYLDAALTLRRAGVPIEKAEQDYLPRLYRAVVEAERVDPNRAEPVCRLGRMLRALMKWNEAAAAQDRALAAEPGFAPALYERAVVTARLHAERLLEVREQALREAGSRLAQEGSLLDAVMPTDTEIEQRDVRLGTLRLRLLADLAALAEVGPGSGLTQAHLDCARGLARVYSPRAPADAGSARSLLESAIRGDPALEEAYEGLARLEESLGDWERAIAIYDAGTAVDPGYLPFRIGRGDARATLALSRLSRGQDTGDLYRLAVDDFSEAVRLQPAKPQAWIRRGATRMDWATATLARGGDPEALLAEAAADLGKALELEPRHPEALRYRAGVQTNLGRYRMDRGGDCLTPFRSADADFAAALELAPNEVEAWVWRGNLRTSHARALELRGEDPEPQYQGAVEDYSRAIALSPTSARCWGARGGVRSNWASWSFTHGRDPLELFRGAEADFRKSLELDEDSAEAWETVGLLHTAWGTWERSRGGQAEPLYETAVAEISRSLDRNPAAAGAWMRRAGANMNWGVALMSRGEDPGRVFEAAVRDFSKALELNPRQLEAWMWRGGLRSNWGAWAMEHGQDPAPLFADAIADYGKALDLHPNSPEALMMRGGVQVNLGVWRMDRDLDPQEPFAAASADFARAIELNPRWTEGWMQRGTVNLNLGRWRARQGQDPEAAFAAAVESYGRAVEVNPRSAEGWSNLGEARLDWVDWRREHDADATDLLATAIAEFTRAIECNPSFADARRRRGKAQHAQGRYVEALADYRKAIELEPACAEALQERIVDADVRARWGDTLLPALRLLPSADEAIRAGRYSESGTLLEQALPILERAHAELSPAERERFCSDATLHHARYQLACVLSLASAGKSSPDAEARPIDAADAGKLRDRAFECLFRMADGGWKEKVQLEQDSDLVPLRQDPRWTELIGRM